LGSAVGGRQRAGWFSDDVLADEAVFVFPGGLVLDDRATILDSMSGPPWDDALSDERVVPLGRRGDHTVRRADRLCAALDAWKR